MSWNDGYERNKFEQEQKAQEKVYRKCGMSDEQIREMYLLDLLEYRNNRNYAMHIQSIEELESNGEECRNTLHKRSLLSMTYMMNLSECSRFGWIDEIEKTALHIAISKLTAEQKELLTLLYRDEYTQTEIAVLQQSSLSSVNKRVSRVCNRIRSLVSENGGLKND